GFGPYAPWVLPQAPDALSVTFDVMAGTLIDNLPSLTDISADVASFSFTTLSGLSAGLIEYLLIGTDASGNITSWDIQGYAFGSCVDNLIDPCVTMGTISYSAGHEDSASVCVHVGFEVCNLNQALNTNDPGTWTMSTTASDSPEPSTDLLLGTGLLGLLSLAARGKHHSPSAPHRGVVGNLQSPR